MEHTLGITAAALILAAAVILCIFALTGFFGKEKAANAEQSGISVSEESTFPKMTLGISRGYLALFAEGSSVPSETYDIMVRSLPDTDRARLVAGIPVESEEELRRLLEDLTS